MREYARNPDVLLFSFDPMHQIHNVEIARAWQMTGKKHTKGCQSNSGRRRINILWAIELSSCEIVPMITEANCDRYSIMAYLTHLHSLYEHTWKNIIIILDNAAYQKSYEVQDHAERLGIQLMYLPPYSPNLALVERVWKFFKKKVMYNTYYETFESFESALYDFFKNWDSNDPEIQFLLTLNFEIISWI